MKLNKVLLSLNDVNVKLCDMYGNMIYPVQSVAELTTTVLDSYVCDDVMGTKVISVIPIEYRYPDSEFSVGYFKIILNVRGN